MKGKIEGIEGWTYDDVDSILEEAGLVRAEDNPNVYTSEECDSVEVIAVLENAYDVTFSMSDNLSLAAYMKRGFIGRPCFLNWLKRCNRKRVRKVRTHETPLFNGDDNTKGE